MVIEECGAVKHNMTFDEADKLLRMFQYWRANLTSKERIKHDSAINEVSSLMCESLIWCKESNTGK